MTIAPAAPVLQSPRALIFTVFGLYVRDLGGWISVQRLIELMDPVGIDAPAVRSSVSRLKKRGILIGERRDGVAGYALSDYAESVLAEGDRRIFRREEPQGADWVLAVFSVPESERTKRHELRSRLSWLGFATISSGTWIAPAHVADDTRRVLARDGLEHYVELFHADHLGFGDAAALVAEWWDLAAIDEQYRAFVAQCQPLLRRWRREGDVAGTGQSAHADYVRLLTIWRQLPYLDPGLPAALLPPRWAGASAANAFAEVQELLENRAREYAIGTV